MSKLQVVELVLSSAFVSGVVTTFLTYLFDIRRNKTSRDYLLRQEAYMKAIASISGISHTVFDYFIKKHAIDGGISAIAVTEFVAAHTRELAPAMLVANSQIKSELRKLTLLIIEGANLIEKLNASVKKTETGYLASRGSDVILLDWKIRIESLQDELIKLMREDLGLL